MTITSYQQFRDTIQRDRWCPRHGSVTKYRGCKITWPAVYGRVLDATKWGGE